MAEEQSLFFLKMRKLVEVIDELRDLGVQEIIELPRIAVLGLQSSGKSSVLESIIGFGMLPRGDGLVTRRPLEMRLKHLPNEVATPYVMFDADNGAKITDMTRAMRRIEELTDEVAGTNDNIVADPIKVTIYSHSCPDLTLVDLPGIAKVKKKGSSQGTDIESVTKGMCKLYCAQERTIILCVCQANVDIATQDSLQMVEQLDPEGERTLGVLTKLDIMNAGTDALSILRGEEVDLRHGFIAVKGRNQQQLKQGMSVMESIEEERKYFDSTEPYKSFSERNTTLGTPVLINRISSIMNKHIKKTLPSIIKEIKEMVDETLQKIEALGVPVPEGDSGKMTKIWEMVQKFVKAYEDTIKGKYSRVKSEKEPTGAQIRVQFKNIFAEFFDGKDDLSDYLTDKQIEQAFINFEGNSFPGMPTYGGFLSLIHPYLDKLYAPADEIVDNIYFNLESTSKKIIETIFQRFPGLEELVSSLTSGVLINQRNATKNMVHNLLDSEKGYIFTSDPDYHKNYGGLLPVLNDLQIATCAPNINKGTKEVVY